jgi:alpha-beta hydrolase superfamily lysophospholipase
VGKHQGREESSLRRVPGLKKGRAYKPEAFMLVKSEGVFYREWTVRDPRAVMIMVHGMGAHSDRFKYFAERANAAGISVYAPELKGFGENIGFEKGDVESISEYHDSIRALRLIAGKQSGRVFLGGESMGGLIVTVHILKYDADYSGLIAIVPAFKDVFKINNADRAGIFINSIFNRHAQVEMPFTGEMLTHDPIILEHLHQDGLEHRLASAYLLKELLFEQLYVSANIKNLNVPVLMLCSGNDMLVDTEHSMKLFTRIKAPKELKVYERLFHALTIEDGREEVFRDILEWVKKRI